MEIIQNLITELGMSFVNTVDNETDGWDEISVKIHAISLFIEMEGIYKVGEKTVSFSANSKTSSGVKASLKVAELRKAMYDFHADKGAWYTMRIKINSDGKFDVSYDYDNKPEFTYEPSHEKYLAEKESFPRSENLTPEWLKKLI